MGSSGALASLAQDRDGFGKLTMTPRFVVWPSVVTVTAPFSSVR